MCKNKLKNYTIPILSHSILNLDLINAKIGYAAPICCIIHNSTL